jgi:hypothetical protein
MQGSPAFVYVACKLQLIGNMLSAIFKKQFAIQIVFYRLRCIVHHSKSIGEIHLIIFIIGVLNVL